MIRPVLEPALVVVAALVLLAFVVLGISRSPQPRRASWLRLGAMVLLLAAIALRPGLGTAPTAAQSSSVEVLLVVDRTTSMSALDWDGHRSRLAGVRRDVADLVDSLPGARFSIVTFGLRTRTLLPSTSDGSLVEDVLGALEAEDPFDGHGSRVDKPLDAIERLLVDREEEHPDRPRIVVLLTDGANTAPGRLRSFSAVADLVDGGLVAGYGSAEGGPMPLAGDHRPSEWVTDPKTGRRALSRIDESTLRTIADQLDVPYVHREEPGGLADVADGWPDGEGPSSSSSGPELPAELELVWLLAIPLLLLAVVELRLHWRRLWQARRAMA